MTCTPMFALAALLSATACVATPAEPHLAAADEQPALSQSVTVPAVRVNKAPS